MLRSLKAGGLGHYSLESEPRKVQSELRHHNWWLKMRADITQWTRICASYSHGRALASISVAGPFDRIGVDMIKFPRLVGNQYAVVF